MARILCVTAGLPGILYSSLELARRLIAVGHGVTYVTDARGRRAVLDAGVRFVTLPPSRYDAFLIADARQGLLDRWLTVRQRRQRAADATGARQLGEIVRSVAPDLILIDGEMHEHIIAASGEGRRVGLLNTFPSIWRRPGLPPTHCLVRPGVGWRGTRSGLSLLWLGLRMRRRARTMGQKLVRLGCDRVSVLRGLAREVGFDFATETDDTQWLSPLTYRRLPVLTLHALEFEFPHVPREHVYYVGPLVTDERPDSRTTASDRTDLAPLLDRLGPRSGERRLIYAGFGSCSSTEPGFLRRLIQAVRGRPDWVLIISLGPQITRSEIGGLPDNVRAYPWVPQMTVLKRADVVVTHGGINTIDEAIVCGVPLLVYCGFQTDMAGNTARIVHHGLGIAGDRDRDTEPIMRGHLDRLMHEPRFRSTVERFRATYLAYRERRVLERTVDALLADGVPA